MGYGTIDLLCDVGGTLSLLMGASLLTCCELLEVAWIYLLQKFCTVFPSAGPALTSVAKFLIPLATDETHADSNITEANMVQRNIPYQNPRLQVNRSHSDGEFDQAFSDTSKGIMTVAIQVSAEDGSNKGDTRECMRSDNNGKNYTREYKFCQAISTSNDEHIEEVLNSPFIDNVSSTNRRDNDKQHNKQHHTICGAKRKATRHYSERLLDSSASLNHGPSSKSKSYSPHMFSSSSPTKPIQKHHGKRKRTTGSPSESCNTRYLLHHFPAPSSAQNFYRGVATAGELQSNESLSTSYVQTRDVPKSLYCSKSPPSPSLYVVHASTGPSLSTAYLPNGNVNRSKPTVTCATSTPTGRTTMQQFYSQKRTSAANSPLGATIKMRSPETLNKKMSNSRNKNSLRLGSEELIV